MMEPTKKPVIYHILLAEDDPEDAILFDEAIMETGLPCEVKKFNNGEDLLLFLTGNYQYRPDLIFLDINMPKKNGKECLVELKRSESVTEIPVIMLTTSMNEKDIGDTFRHKASLYVSKPSCFSHLVNILTNIFSLHEQGLLKDPEPESFVLGYPQEMH